MLISRCCLCNRVLGVKPSESDGITDGFCDNCLNLMKTNPDEYNRRAKKAREKKIKKANY